VFSLGGSFPPSSLATAKARYSACNTTPFLCMLTGLSPSPVLLSSKLQLAPDWIVYVASKTPHLHCITAAIRFGLGRFRSPLLTASLLISFPPATQMFPFAEFAFPKRERKESFGILFTKSHSGILGSTDACSYPRHIAACHALHRLPSLAIHQTASARRMITLSTNAYATCARRSSQAEQKLATSFDSRRPPSRSASLLFSPTRRDWQGLTCHPSKNGKLTRAFSFLDSQKANRLPPNARNFFLRR
jgi:hypothetical protein